MRRIRVRVEFKESPILKQVRSVKEHLMYARSLLTLEIRTKLMEDSTVDLALETEGTGIEKEKMYLFAEVDFEKEKELSKEICDLCEELAQKTREYDALMKFELLRASEEPDTRK